MISSRLGFAHLTAFVAVSSIWRFAGSERRRRRL
jgi:hypothetical protein